MLVNENGKRIELLGDPHLGRAFHHGVALGRRGEREAMVWADFLENLRGGSPSVDYHVCLGDLFDKWIVSFDLILDVASQYEAAAAERPNTSFMILKGNHDWIRDLERRSAFDVFAKLVAHVPNIYIVDQIIEMDGLVFYPWHPLWDAKEKLKGVAGNILFGHFDTEFGDHNMVPTQLDFERIYTGHIHKPERFNRHGTEVVVVGSLQPYAHGEEADDSLYVTLRPEDVSGDLRMKCVRIIGRYEGEIDCLQLTYKSEQKEDEVIENVTLGDFDMDKLFAEAFAEAGVTPERSAHVLEQFHSKRNADGL